MAKFGGFAGVFLFPTLMDLHGLAGAEWVAAIVSIVGLVVTWTMLPETKGQSLEDLNSEGQVNEPSAKSSEGNKARTARA